MIALGIEIGGTKLQVAAVDETGTVHTRETASVDSNAGAESIRERLIGLIEKVRQRVDAVAVGVGFGGPVDREAGTIARSFHVGGWDGFALAAWVQSVVPGLPVFIENDTNAAAYAEATLGAGRGFDPVVYSNAGSGVGGGLVINGELYYSAPPGEMEIGHLWLEHRGGIVEDSCSGWAIDRRVREAVKAAPDSALAHHCANLDRGETRALAPALAAGDGAARAILDEAARDYAIALSHALNLLHPQIIVLGGGVAEIGEPWRATVQRYLEEFAMATFRASVRVALTELGDAVVPIGAAALALRRDGRSARV